MYFDTKPCTVCGADVELRPRETPTDSGTAPVGGPPGETGDADPTVDERVCTNASCASHDANGPDA